MRLARRGLLVILFLALAPVGWAASTGFPGDFAWLQDTTSTDATTTDPTTTDTTTTTPTPTDTTAPVLSGVPGDISEAAQFPSGKNVIWSPPSATDDVDGPVPVSCNPPSGSNFAVGTTLVTCSASDAAGNSAQATFNVVVTFADTTAPVLSGVPGDIAENTESPSGKVVTWSVPTASDSVDGTLAVTCAPASGASFAVGTTSVTCSATDSAGNTGSGTFNVTVTLVDATPPTLSVPGPITAEATSPGGASVAFTVTASDAIDLFPSVSCSHSPGATFPIGTTTVSCTATDASSNTSAPSTFTVSVVDRGAPTVSVPGTITREATGPSGATATFAVTASDVIDASPTVSCNRSSGQVFPLGNTTVSCTARDASNNTSTPATFVVTVVDTTGPNLSNVPANLTVEASTRNGSTKVNFAKPGAVDLVDGPIANVSCSPASGSTFALGTTTVTCSAADSRSNSRSASFNVKVVDTTPPSLVVPVSLGIHATTTEGIPRSPALDGFLASASAADIVDPSPVVTNNSPAFFPLGTTDVTWTARDASGNAVSRSAAIVVLPKPPPGTPPLPIPPAPRRPDNPGKVNVTAGDGTVTLAWTAVAGAKQYLVYRSTREARRLTAVGHGELVYSGTATRFTDRGLKNGVEYRYVVVVEDAAGNQSVGVAIVVVPKQDLLRSPKNGARLRKPPRLVWRADAEADYYNAQLLFAGKKILSVWPTRAQFQLKKSWKYLGKSYTLKPGLYTWYVWPGYGAREEVDYGELMGSRTFRIVPSKRR